MNNFQNHRSRDTNQRVTFRASMHPLFELYGLHGS